MKEMTEIMELIQKAVLFCVLIMTAYEDWKYKTIRTSVLCVSGAAGIVLHLYNMPNDSRDMILGAAVGVGIWVLAAVSGERIGKGDGALFTVSGIFLGFEKNLALFLTALFLAGIAAFFLLTIGRKERSYQIPFVPFVLAGYLMVLLAK